MFKNKKGFTLIEMLVVIAIIAVLVAIIIPVIGNSTVKASAAANAANLRSYASEIAILYLEPGDMTVEVTADNVITFKNGTAPTAPVSKKCGSVDATENVPAKAFLVNGQVVAAFSDKYVKGTKDVEYYAYIAANGEAPKSTEAKPTAIVLPNGEVLIPA